MKKIPKIILTAACFLSSIAFSCGASSGAKTRQSTGDQALDSMLMQQGYTIIYGKQNNRTAKQVRAQQVQTQAKTSTVPVQIPTRITAPARQIQPSMSKAEPSSSRAKTRQSSGDPAIDSIWMQQGYTIVYGKQSNSTAKQPQIAVSATPVQVATPKPVQTQQHQAKVSVAPTQIPTRITAPAQQIQPSISKAAPSSSGAKTRQSTGDQALDSILMQQGYTIVYGKQSNNTTKQVQAEVSTTPVQVAAPKPVQIQQAQTQAKTSVTPAQASTPKTTPVQVTTPKPVSTQQHQAKVSVAPTPVSMPVQQNQTNGTPVVTPSADTGIKTQQQTEHVRQVPIYAFADVHLVQPTVNKIAELLSHRCHVLINGDIPGKHVIGNRSIRIDQNPGDPQSVIRVWQPVLRQGKGDLYCGIGNHEILRENFPDGITPRSWIKSLKNIGAHWVGTYPEPRVRNHYQSDASAAILETVESVARFDNTLVLSYLDSKYRDVGISEKNHINDGIQTMVQQLYANQFNQLEEIILSLHCCHGEAKNVIEGFVSSLMRLDAQKKLIFNLPRARIIAIGGHEHISQNKQQRIDVNYQAKTKTVGYYSAQSGHAYIEILPDGKVSFKKIQ